MQDWRETVGWFRDKINGPVLTLRLIGAETIYGHPEPEATVAEGDTIHRAYMDLLQPLKQLAEGQNRLAAFHADLPYPWQWTYESRNRENLCEWLRDRKRELKRTAERLVMGDRYESMYADGKEEPEQSLWQHVVYHHH
jgi:hypothetical protein